MDILNDTNFVTWLHINEKLQEQIPTYVKEYTPLTKEGSSNLTDNQWADDVRRWFPIDCKENTWMSAAYFGFNEDKLPYKQAMRDYVKTRIIKAAGLYDIRKDVDEVFNKMSETQAPVVFYGLVVDNPPGVMDMEFPLNSMNEVKQAAEYFNEYRFNYTPEQRKEIAGNIVKRAEVLGVDVETLPKSVHVDAGYGIPDKLELVTEILDRAHLSKDAELSLALANIGQMICELPSIAESTEALQKLAEVISEYDRATGLDKRVARGKLLAAEDIVFGTSINKAASALSDAIKLDKYVFSITKLAELDNNIFANILGDEFVEKIKTENKVDPVKLAGALDKLNIEDKVALEEYIQSIFE